MKIYVVWPVRVELPWISSAQCTTCNDCWNTSKEKCFHTQINLSQVQGYILTLPGRGARILIIWHVTSVQEMFCFSGCKSESKKKEAKLKKIKKKICWMWLKSQTTKCGERDQRKSQDLSHHLLLIQKKKKCIPSSGISFTLSRTDILTPSRSEQQHCRQTFISHEKPKERGGSGSRRVKGQAGSRLVS